MTIDPALIPRYDDGSRVPGWDDAADLTKDPMSVPDPASTVVPEDLRAEIEAEIAKYPERRAATIAALKAVQRRYGWCSPEGVVQAACVLGQTPADLVAVGSFYDMFHLRPAGRTDVYVCTNISCSLCGAHDLYAAFQEHGSDDPDINVRSFECLGACDIAPMASVNGTYIGPLAPADVPELLRQVRAGEDPLPEKQIARRASVDPNVTGAPS
jgi:NADH:ubiquinone oxidoreductase subunit E